MKTTRTKRWRQCPTCKTGRIQYLEVCRDCMMKECSAMRKKKIQKAPRATVHCSLGNFVVHDLMLNRILCLCVVEQDAHLIAGLLNDREAL